MKLFISVDMEGISGLANWQEAEISKHMEGDLLAAIEGALEAGVEYILVADSHGRGMNIRPEILPDNVDLYRGYPRPFYMVEGLTSDFDLAFFIGYHAPAGFYTGQMDHTFSTTLYRVTVNGEEFGEAELNGLFAGSHGVPVGLITGDRALFEFSRNKFPETTEFVVTKEGVSKYSAKLYPVRRVREEIREKAKIVASKASELKIFSREKQEEGYTVEIELVDTLSADFASLMPGMERLSGRKLKYRAKSADEILKLINSVSILSSASRFMNH